MNSSNINNLNNNKIIYGKIILTDNSCLSEILEACELIKKYNLNNFNLILQPVTPVNNILPPSPEKTLEIQTQLIKFFKNNNINNINTRVIPQTHKLIKQL